MLYLIYCILKECTKHILNYKKSEQRERERERRGDRIKKTNSIGEFENVSEGIDYKILTCEGEFQMKSRRDGLAKKIMAVRVFMCKACYVSFNEHRVI